jgi:hypothetical protein
MRAEAASAGFYTSPWGGTHPRIQLITVNGGAGLLVGRPGRPLAVVGFTFAGGRIVAIDLITDRDKLRRLAGEG